jgi:hypothetical protein
MNAAGRTAHTMNKDLADQDSTAGSDDFTVDRDEFDRESGYDRADGSTEDISDDGAGSPLFVATCIGRAVDKRELPYRRVSLGMRLAEDLIQSALLLSTSPLVSPLVVPAGAEQPPTKPQAAQAVSSSQAQWDDAARMAVARSLVEGLCDVALRDVSASTINRSIRAAAAQRRRKRTATARDLATGAFAGSDEQQFAARLLQRWARMHGAPPRAHRATADAAAAMTELGLHAEAQYAAQLVQKWVRHHLLRRHGRRSDLDASAAADQQPQKEEAAAPVPAQEQQPLTESLPPPAPEQHEEPVPQTQQPTEVPPAEPPVRQEDSQDYSVVQTAEGTQQQTPLVPQRTGASEEEDWERREVERRRQLIARYLALKGPSFKSESAARAYLGRTVALSRTERVSRNDMEIVFLAFSAGVQSHLNMMRDIATQWYTDQCTILAMELHERDDLLDEYVGFVEAAHHASWALRYGADSAERYEDLCVAVAATEAEARGAVAKEQASEFTSLASMDPRPRRRRIQRAVESRTLDDAHNASVAPTNATTSTTTRPNDRSASVDSRLISTHSRAPTAASAAREAVVEERVKRAAGVRGEGKVIEDLCAASKVVEETSNHTRMAYRRDERVAKHDAFLATQSAQMEQRRAAAKLDGIARRQNAQLRHAPPAERAAMEKALGRVKQEPWDIRLDNDRGYFGPREHASVARSAQRGGATRKPPVKAPARRASPTSQPKRYMTSTTYGKPEGTTEQHVNPNDMTNNNDNNNSSRRVPRVLSPIPTRASTPLVHERSTALLPVEQKLVDDVATLQDVCRDFVGAARMYSPSALRMKRSLRLHVAQMKVLEVKARLQQSELIDLSPRSRITRWNLEAADLLSEGQVGVATRLMKTVRHELGEYGKLLRRAPSSGSTSRGSPATTNLVPPDSMEEQIVLLRLEAAVQQNEATRAKAAGQTVDAVRHLQQRMAAEEQIGRVAAATAGVGGSKSPRNTASLLPPPQLVAPNGTTFEAMLSVSALLATIEEPEAALQYGRAAARIISAAAVKLATQVRDAALVGEWPSPADLDELTADANKLSTAAAMALHNVAMAQLLCPAELRLGERPAAPTTYRAAVRVAEQATGSDSAAVQRLKLSSGHFARVLGQTRPGSSMSNARTEGSNAGAATGQSDHL